MYTFGQPKPIYFRNQRRSVIRVLCMENGRIFNCVVEVFLRSCERLEQPFRTGRLVWRPAPCQQTPQHSIGYAHAYNLQLKNLQTA